MRLPANARCRRCRASVSACADSIRGGPGGRHQCPARCQECPRVLPEAEAALGFRSKSSPAAKEARLIYLGAVHSLPAAQRKRLVVDIGGGSAEFIIGRRIEPQLMESLYMGCVSYDAFLPGRPHRQEAHA